MAFCLLKYSKRGGRAIDRLADILKYLYICGIKSKGKQMRKRLLFLSALIMAAGLSFGQAFELITSNVKALGESSSAWGDYDNDGDLDIAIMGTDSQQAWALIYRNDEGTFTDIEAGLPGIEKGDISWVDYDLDGDLDLMLLGRGAEENITDMFINQDGVFTPAGLGLQTVIEGCAAWSDFDLDGDLDVLVSGDKNSYNPFTMLYQNNDGVFEETDFGLEIAKSSIAAWGDFDNDGDEDLFLAGNGNIMFAKIYRNDIDGFTDMEFDMKAQYAGGADWGDYDRDGDLDLLVNGFNEFLEAETILYGNSGGKQMKEIPAYLDKSAAGNAEWGDYDNDGDLDMVYTGKGAGCGLIFSKVVRNDDGIYFNDAWAELEPLQRSHASWGDYDNDGDLDLLLSGFNATGYEPFTGIYQNPTITARAISIAPEGLSSHVEEAYVQLEWQSGGMLQNTWNLRIGTSPGASDIVNPLSDEQSGFRRMPVKGNVSVDTSWVLFGLDPGTYYWSVQSVDHCFAGSEFAEEQSFEVTLTGIENTFNENLRIYPNPVQDVMHITFDGGFEIRIMDINGRLIRQSSAINEAQIETASLKEGVYVLQIWQDGSLMNKKIVIQ